MKLIHFVFIAAVVSALPSRAQPFCAASPPPSCKTGYLIGDPLDVVNTTMHDRHVDISLPSTLGTFEFIRYYSGDEQAWGSCGYPPLPDWRSVLLDPAPLPGPVLRPRNGSLPELE